MLNKRTAEVIEELSTEKKRNTSLVSDLKAYQEKLSGAEAQLETVNKELQAVSYLKPFRFNHCFFTNLM